MSSSPDSSPNPAAELFRHKTDAELLYLAQQPQRYPAPVVEAAVQELQRRGLVPAPPAELPVAPPAPPAEAPAAGVGAVLRGVFWPRPGYFVAPLLLALNLLVYALMALNGVDALAPTGPDLVRWGSNFSPLSLGGQPWRLLTSCFVHGGPAHLLLNMSSLVFLGLLTEPLVGRGRLLAGYLLSGVGGSVASLWWHLPQGVNSVGASGAIFGLYGLLLATLALYPATLPDHAARRSLLVFGVYLLFSSLGAGLQAHATDNAAHVGGLLVGLLMGAWPRSRRLPPPAEQKLG
ncbi:rhomboid family intramembrane serine protease [Hymenobacter weizhouensis]|uniref:rhomboid family intramembrane serine protease n=1 Tax=Hymenobacter sp. YIM 151500-1 TaxID=2987689 RepID=UPI0022260A47|nr:rhomboid family intramembrane serine protease [Hymenobacter sp. YIM 151500-1]UYZ63424.1 rhomboid family intramembrane serine protease [Hymenobacter sp. YIM 151500-1]